MAKEKYISEKVNCFYVVKTVDRKLVYFGSVMKTENSPFIKAKRMRDIVVAMLDAGKTIKQVKKSIGELDLSKPKIVNEFIRSLSTDPEPEPENMNMFEETEFENVDTFTPVTSATASVTEVFDTPNDEIEEVEETKVSEANTSTSLEFSKLDNDSLELFTRYFNSINPSQSELSQFNQVFSNINSINNSINVLNQSISDVMPSLELMYYKCEAENYKKENKTLKQKLTRIENKQLV